MRGCDDERICTSHNGRARKGHAAACCSRDILASKVMNILRLRSSCLLKTVAGLRYGSSFSTQGCLRKLFCLQSCLTRNETRRFSSTSRHFSTTERLASNIGAGNAISPDQPPSNSFPFLGLSDKNQSDHVSYPITLVLDGEGKTRRQEDVVERIDSKHSGDRRYKFTADNGDVQIFPSVTTVLQNTMPAVKRIILSNWQKKVVRQYGAKGFDELKKTVVDNGKIFHKVSHQI